MQKKLSINPKMRLRILISMLLGVPILGFSAEFSVKNADELEIALLQAGQNTEANQIIITDDIKLKHLLPALTGQLQLDGQGHKSNGRQLFRVFSIAEGKIQIKNLDIVDGKAQGQTGDPFHFGGGGGGAAGLGGGLYIQAGQVDLKQVNFIGNQAIGGVGGHYLEKESDGSGGNGAAFNFAPSLQTSLAHHSSLFPDKVPISPSKTSLSAAKVSSPYQLSNGNADHIVTTPEPEIKHIAQ